MPQDAFHLTRVATELHTLLVGSKVNRIAQPNKDEVDFLLYTGTRTVRLACVTSASTARVCLTDTEKPPLDKAPNFCMLLRKHLQGAKILEISTVGFERVLELRFDCVNDFSRTERVLYAEIMGKYSNLVLVENGLVLGALKTTSLETNSERILFAGAKYALPKPQDKISPFDDERLLTFAKVFDDKKAEGADEESLAVTLFENVSGFALSTAREVVKRLQNRSLGAFLPDFIRNEPIDAHLIDGVDFFAFPVQGGVRVPSLLKAEDSFYTKKEGDKTFSAFKKKLESTAQNAKKKMQKKLQQTLEKLAEAQRAEDNRKKGELLTASLWKVRGGEKSVTVDDYYTGTTMTIALDPKLSPQKNAQNYFKTYAKQKRTVEMLTPRKVEEEGEIAYLDSVLFAVDKAVDFTDLREIERELIDGGFLRQATGKKKKVDEPLPYRLYEVDGFTIAVGRNNVQNDRLLKESRGEDVWLHAQKYHSAHAVVRLEGRTISEKALLTACEIVAFFSNAKGDSVSVDYCLKKYVRKPPKSKAGFVTYTDYKTLYVTPNAHELYKK